MRLVLIASFSSLNAENDAIVLRARGYDVVTYYELHKRDHPYNKGNPAHTTEAHVNLLCEVVNERASLAVHPECDPALVQEVASVCRFIGVKLLRMESLPLLAPERGDRRWKDPLPCLAARDEEAEGRIVHHLNHAPKRGSAAYLMGQRLRTAYRTVQRLIARADSAIGDGLKNPMTRRAPLRRYTTDQVPLTNTG